MGVFEATIGPDDADRRLEAVLKRRLGLPHAAVHRLFRQGEVKVDRRRVRDPAFRVAEGQRLTVYGVEVDVEAGASRYGVEGSFTSAGRGRARGEAAGGGPGEAAPAPRLSPAAAARLEARVVYQDAHLVALDKAAGVVVHRGTGHARGLIDDLVVWLGAPAAASGGGAASEAGGEGDLDADLDLDADADAEVDADRNADRDRDADVDTDREAAGRVDLDPNERPAAAPLPPQGPVLVHRLDRETSGLLLLALTGPSARALSALLRERKMDKRYLAIVRGAPADDAGRIEVPLRKDHSATVVTGPADPEGQRAVSTYIVLERGALAGEPAALVELSPLTGRRHQLRVHMAWLGHPIAGDADYGDGPWNARLRRAVGLKRLALHASRLRFPHPATGAPLALEAPWPPALARVWPYTPGRRDGAADPAAPQADPGPRPK